MSETEPQPDVLTPAAPEPSAERLTESKMTEGMEAVWNRLNGPEALEAERAANPQMPVPQKPRNDEDFKAAALDWHSMTIEQRREIVNAHDEIARRKKQADEFGISLEAREAIDQSLNRPAPAELQPAVQIYSELYPDQQPAAIVEWDAKVHRYLKADPENGLRWLAEQMGYRVNPERIE